MMNEFIDSVFVCFFSQVLMSEKIKLFFANFPVVAQLFESNSAF